MKNLHLPTAVLPNETVKSNVTLMIGLGWIALVALFWATVQVPMVPAPGPTLGEIVNQWNKGAFYQLLASLTISFEAILWAIGIGLGLAYLATIPLFKPFVSALGKLRFLSLSGTVLVFVASFSGHGLKVAVLTFTIVTFLLNDMLRVIDSIPQEKFDHARTLGFNRWEVLREVVIRGTLHEAFDSLRMNAAIAWMMLTAVETLSRSEGGVGVLLLALQKSFNLPAVFAVQIMIFAVGIAQDQIIKGAKAAFCPYTVRK
jgi:NitT/TauT family transport system permease protein